MSDIVSIRVPAIGYKPEDMEDAEGYARAATNLRGGYQVGGSNMRTAVALLLDRVCLALDGATNTSESLSPSTVSAFPLGIRVRKTKGASWQGRVVGHYSTSLTTDGVCVESEREPGSVQIYPVAALEQIEEKP